jgi:hypothetical protein
MEYFNRIENAPFVDYNSYQNQQKWNFIYHPYRKPSNDLRAGEDMEEEIYEDELDFVEIYVGDPQNPYQIPVTPDLDLIELMRDWCFNYCYARGYKILELINGCGDLQNTQYLSDEDFIHGAIQSDNHFSIAHRLAMGILVGNE